MNDNRMNTNKWGDRESFVFWLFGVVLTGGVENRF
jgi:hypothetical protein